MSRHPQRTWVRDRRPPSPLVLVLSRDVGVTYTGSGTTRVRPLESGEKGLLRLRISSFPNGAGGSSLTTGGLEVRRRTAGEDPGDATGAGVVPLPGDLLSVGPENP